MPTARLPPEGGVSARLPPAGGVSARLPALSARLPGAFGGAFLMLLFLPSVACAFGALMQGTMGTRGAYDDAV